MLDAPTRPRDSTEHSTPSPVSRSGSRSVVEHPVDQPGDGSNAHRVALAPVPVHVGHRPEPAQPTDPVLHDDPTPAERPVVLPVRRRAFLPTRLAARARAGTGR